MYANELTGLCRPEELVQLFRYGTMLSKQCGVKMDSAMLSDVPGMTWGTATAMSEAGIRYFSLAPNFFDRIGSIMVTWQDKPFWWVGPSGKDRVLVWVPWTGYAMSHIVGRLTPTWVGDYQKRLDDVRFSYDISYIRWSGHGDNAVPDEQICEDVKTWNTTYAWPKFRIASTHDAFAAFEKRYGKDLPQYKGDLTPYWEDGAASSARDGAESQRRRPARAGRGAVRDAGRIVPGDGVSRRLAERAALFRAHLGGMVQRLRFRKPVHEEPVGGQAGVRTQCRPSIDQAAGRRAGIGIGVRGRVGGGRVQHRLLAAQRTRIDPQGPLDSRGPRHRRAGPAGSLAAAFVRGAGHAVRRRAALRSGAVPRRGAGPAFAPRNPVMLDGASLANGMLRAGVDDKTGGIVELTLNGIDHNFADPNGGEPLNDYVYLTGDKLADLQGSGPATITAIEKGPLVASLRIESAAPGCNTLTRDLRLVAGMDHLDVVNTLDKSRVPLNPHPGEGGPGGVCAARLEGERELRLPVRRAGRAGTAGRAAGGDAAGGRPASRACKNWLPVGRWADVSNGSRGVTLAMLDVPLVELGRLSTLLGSQSHPDAWRQHVEPTQRSIHG